MAEKLSSQEVVDFKELLITNMIEIQAVTQLLLEKGIITEFEWIDKLKTIQKEYLEIADRQ